MSNNRKKLNIESGFQRLEVKIIKLQKEAEVKEWGLRKTNEAIKVLYKDLEIKTKALAIVNEDLKEMDRLKNDFISTVSHELRTPLSITKEGISVLLDGLTGEINEKQKHVLIIARNNLKRLARIIDDLLDISKIEAGKVELRKHFIDICDLIRRLLETFKLNTQEKNIELLYHTNREHLSIYADPDKIIQVITNLVSNAIKFTKKDGQIGIDLIDKEDQIQICVKDTGIGIAKENLPKVFSKFQQFNRSPGPGIKGTGLGLSICRGLVEMHKGKIWLESELGKGCKFIFTLPKLSSEEILKDYITNSIEEVTERSSVLSLIGVGLTKYEQIRKDAGEEEITDLLKEIELVIQEALRRESDIAIRHADEIIVFYPMLKRKI